MLVNRSWMRRRIEGKGTLSVEFQQGVKEFLNFAFTHEEFMDGGKIKCPCAHCKLLHYEDREVVHFHLLRKGFLGNYTLWTEHGEREVVPPTVDNVVDVAAACSNPYRDLVMDAVGCDWDCDSVVQGLQGIQEPNLNTQKFYDLLKDADEPLWAGCETHSKLSIVTQLLHIKSTFGIPNKGIEAILKLMKTSMPKDEKLPGTYYKVKHYVKTLGLGHTKIHACFNDCVLYYKENKDKKECPICSHPRYKPNSGRDGEKEIAWKILRYFPLTPRLQRLYQSSKTAEHMRWHSDSRVEVPGEMRHPADGEAWKDFDRTHPSFASEVRNVRLGLATDGFNPHGHSSTPYSCWPVIVTPYNLPPWMCMKKPYMFLTLVIPGPKSPGKDLDVYIRPLIDELKMLWGVGVQTYDVSVKQNFQMKAALMWTISDFPAYGMLSGWSTHGKMSCPYCMERTKAFRLDNSSKVSFFDCHRQFLPRNHPFRKQRDKFKKGIEKDHGIERKSGAEVENIVSRLKQVTFGKGSGVHKIRGYGDYHHWTKQSIFFELPYWGTLLIRHNLDVMHIEKNVFDNVFNTVMNVKGKSKDHLKARQDLEALGIRSNLHPEVINGKVTLPKACYSLGKDDIKHVCEWAKQLKFPDGYASNISRCVNVNECKFHGLKSHDCHVFMQRLLPITFRDFLPKPVTEVLTELSHFFRDICSTIIRESDMEILEKNIVVTICKLEKIFPPSFFDSMEHLPIHLPFEAKVGGPVLYRWMYPFERCMHDLKKKVRNKARVEGSICEAYSIEELVTFCSYYFESDIETRFNRPERNFDGGEVDPKGRLSIFYHPGRAIGGGSDRYLDDKEEVAAMLYILTNCEEVTPFIVEHEQELRHHNPEITEQEVEQERNLKFIEWFKSRVLYKEEVDYRLQQLAVGPSKRVRHYKGYIVNGFKFHTKDLEPTKKTSNSGVMIKGSCYNDYECDFYGRLNDIVELDFMGDGNRVILFKCDWFDTQKGVKVDRYGIVDVKYGSTLNAYEPFVLASQVTQVFYAASVSKKNKDWCTVIKTKARNTYDVPPDIERDIAPTMDETFLQEDDIPVVESYVVDDNLDNVSLRTSGPGEEVDLEDLTIPANRVVAEDDEEDEEEEEEEMEEEEEEGSDDDMEVDDD